jgi:hypothetical protein
MRYGHHIHRKDWSDDAIMHAALMLLNLELRAEQGDVDVRKKRVGKGWRVEYGIFTKRSLANQQKRAHG